MLSRHIAGIEQGLNVGLHVVRDCVIARAVWCELLPPKKYWQLLWGTTSLVSTNWVDGNILGKLG